MCRGGACRVAKKHGDVPLGAGQKLKTVTRAGGGKGTQFQVGWGCILGVKNRTSEGVFGGEKIGMVSCHLGGTERGFGGGKRGEKGCTNSVRGCRGKGWGTGKSGLFVPQRDRRVGDGVGGFLFFQRQKKPKPVTEGGLGGRPGGCRMRTAGCKKGRLF